MKALLLLLLAGPACTLAAKSSYAELIEEEEQGLSELEKNARSYLRKVEHRAGRKLTRQEVRKAYADKIKVFDDLDKSHDAKEKVQAVRDWVRSVAPIMSSGDDVVGTKFDSFGPMHLVLQAASKIVGRDHVDENHPYKEAKEIIVGIRDFTRAIIQYFNDREIKDEL